MINFVAMLFTTCYIFRPKDGSKVLAEVDELLDETLTEIGPYENELSRRVDSVEYAEELREKMKARELQVINYQEQSQHEINEIDFIKKEEPRQEFQFQLEVENQVEEAVNDPDEVQPLD